MLGKFNPRRLSLRAKLQRDPYYRLQSTEEIQVAADLGIKIDVNQASVDDWLRLPGISIHQAHALVELVAMGVPLLCLEDVAAALGLTPRHLQHLEPILSFCHYDPQSLLHPPRVNPNNASLEELSTIVIINYPVAVAIVENRQKYGKYRNLADLQRRLGLSSKFAAQLMYYFTYS